MQETKVMNCNILAPRCFREVSGMVPEMCIIKVGLPHKHLAKYLGVLPCEREDHLTTAACRKREGFDC